MSPHHVTVSKRHLAGSGRAEILSAATREFADRGYSGATTAGIARLAGVTQPLVHHHFGSKQGLWNAVLEALFQEFYDVLGQAMREVEGPTGSPACRACCGPM